ncbi:hypothetical protein J21TS3_38570 [Paenibacillus cookii]|uniref:Uncharacterized protein n=1 Tax=Paenibacillus cookii TaxID=157839 RepID=A0ABQ4M0H9_9BACL|nr:hypothetical protein J21TS3_38570 [Paenibacillus cookii]
MEQADQAAAPQAFPRPFRRVQDETVQRVRRYVANRGKGVDSHAARCSFTPQHAAGFIWQSGNKVFGDLPSARGIEPDFPPDRMRICQP